MSDGDEKRETNSGGDAKLRDATPPETRRLRGQERSGAIARNRFVGLFLRPIANPTDFLLPSNCKTLYVGASGGLDTSRTMRAIKDQMEEELTCE